jgi:hypothetical protein
MAGDYRRVIRIDRLMRQLYGANQSEDSVALASRAFRCLGGAHRGH